jgi:hypothetical protein
MMKRDKFFMTAGSLLLAAVLVLGACGGKSAGGSGSGGNAVKGAVGAAQNVLDGLRSAADTRLEEIKGKDLALPENAVTETDTDRIDGWIIRGKTNLKLSGPVTSVQLRAIAKAMADAYETNKQLFRLDLSATGITALQDYCFSPTGYPYLGEVALPEGIKQIGENAYENQYNLYAINLPNSLEYIGANAFYYVWLPKVVVPAKLDLVGNADNYYGNSVGGSLPQFGFLLPHSGKETTYVFRDGVTTMNMALFEPEEKGSAAKYVLPPSFKSFFVINSNGMGNIDWAKLAGITELYCYAPTPPVYQPPAGLSSEFSEFSEAKAQLCLDSVKTIYVPAGSEKTYEDAWFNYTGAEFKTLPVALSTIDQWY